MIETSHFLKMTAETQADHYIFLTVLRLNLIPFKIIENSVPKTDQLCQWVKISVLWSVNTPFREQLMLVQNLLEVL
jgi:hypothetical protein